MSKSSSSSQITSLESVLEQHIPRDQLAEVKRILYGNAVENLPFQTRQTVNSKKKKKKKKLFKSNKKKKNNICFFLILSFGFTTQV
jgi:hypothetical protein